MVLLAPRPVSVTELGACAKEVSPVEIFPGPAGPWPLGGLARGPAGGCTGMCSGCTGDPEDPPEGAPELEELDASPFWAAWKDAPEEDEEK